MTIVYTPYPANGSSVPSAGLTFGVGITGGTVSLPGEVVTQIEIVVSVNGVNIAGGDAFQDAGVGGGSFGFDNSVKGPGYYYDYSDLSNIQIRMATLSPLNQGDLVLHHISVLVLTRPAHYDLYTADYTFTIDNTTGDGGDGGDGGSTETPGFVNLSLTPATKSFSFTNFSKIVAKNKDISQIQLHTSRAVDVVKNASIMYGNLIRNVAISPSGSLVAHRLDKPYSGYIITEQNNTANVWDKSGNREPRKYIGLQSTISTICSLWVF